MKVVRKEGSKGRRVLIAMVTSKEVLSRVASVWPKEHGLFASEWENKVAGWCISHYRRYGRSPAKGIEAIFEEWAEKTSDKDQITAIERFLVSLSEESARSKDTDADHVIDMAEELFNRNHLQREQQEVEELIEAGKIQDALKRRDAYRRVSLKGEQHIDLFDCAGELTLALAAANAEPLVRYPGGIGKFFGKQLVRDSLVGVMAAEKMAKSFMLLDIGYRGAQQGNNVAYFQVGDLSRDQIMQRVASRAAKRPIGKERYDYPTSLEIVGNTGNVGWADTEARSTKRELTTKEVEEVLRAEIKKDKFRLMVYPNASVNITMIESRLESMSQRGWACDICIIDYADLLAPVNGTDETRDQINQTWTLMRSISQKRNCLLVTATQASAASYKATQLDKSHFSNDKRKYAHITAMLAINQGEQEKVCGVQRLNWIDVRSEPFSRKSFCFVAGCLAIANPCVKSLYGKEDDTREPTARRRQK